jgi:hypothetical protein
MRASIPNPVRFGQPTSVSATQSDLGQTDIGINLQVVWMQPLNDKFSVSIFGGPTLLHVKQDVGTLTATATPTASVDSESKTTGKAGNAGVAVTYKMTDRYDVGVFVRYSGGQVDLPAVSKLTVGGAQVGGMVCVRF